MRLHGGGIDEHLGRRTAGARQGMEEIDPDALGRPAHIAVVERLARPVIGRRIDPPPAGLQDMHDAADHPAVVNTRLATRIRWQMRLDPRKLCVRQPKTIPIHPSFFPEAVNHTEPAVPIILWVRTLTFNLDLSAGAGQYFGRQVTTMARLPEDWKDKPARLAQKDRDARWTVKYTKAKPREDGSRPAVDLAIPAFGYKNQVSIDRGFGLIRKWTTNRYAVAPRRSRSAEECCLTDAGCETLSLGPRRMRALKSVLAVS